MRSSWIRVALNPVTGVLIRYRREDTQTQRRRPWENRGRNWSAFAFLSASLESVGPRRPSLQEGADRCDMTSDPFPCFPLLTLSQQQALLQNGSNRAGSREGETENDLGSQIANSYAKRKLFLH